MLTVTGADGMQMIVTLNFLLGHCDLFFANARLPGFRSC